jgi:hypothetical protein
MRFQINGGGWAIGQILVPAGTVINIVDAPDHELGEFQRLARGKIPPLDSTALDYDCAVLLWRLYPGQRHRLRRSLSEFDATMFEKMLSMNEEALKHWPRGAE